MVTQKLDQFWKFYHQLSEYKECPNLASSKALEEKFDEIFTHITGYQALETDLQR